jgi:hypothetical protein
MVALRIGIAGLVMAGALAAPATAESRGTDQRCFTASVGIHKTSLGVHQWTVRQRTRWCSARVGGRREIVSLRRELRVRTGTNWKLVSKRIDADRGRRSATNTAQFHFRLRYPYFEQNCYPRLAITMTAGGESRTSRETGC